MYYVLWFFVVFSFFRSVIVWEFWVEDFWDIGLLGCWVGGGGDVGWVGVGLRVGFVVLFMEFCLCFCFVVLDFVVLVGCFLVCFEEEWGGLGFWFVGVCWLVVLSFLFFFNVVICCGGVDVIGEFWGWLFCFVEVFLVGWGVLFGGLGFGGWIWGGGLDGGVLDGFFGFIGFVDWVFWGLFGGFFVGFILVGLLGDWYLLGLGFFGGCWLLGGLFELLCGDIFFRVICGVVLLGCCCWFLGEVWLGFVLLG